MPKFRTCTFCGRDLEPGTGLMYVLSTGQVLWFCSSKCFKNHVKLRRKPAKLAWVRKTGGFK